MLTPTEFEDIQREIKEAERQLAQLMRDLKVTLFILITHYIYCTFLSHWRAHDRISALNEDYGFAYRAFRWKTEDV